MWYSSMTSYNFEPHQNILDWKVILHHNVFERLRQCFICKISLEQKPVVEVENRAKLGKVVQRIVE